MAASEQPLWAPKLRKSFECYVIPVILLPQRIIITIFGSSCYAMLYAMRNCYAITKVQMLAPLNNTKFFLQEDICPPSEENDKLKYKHDFDWTEEEQSRMLMAFYATYFVTHIPSGLLADRYGSKIILICGMLASALVTLFTPLIIYTYKAEGLFVCRIFLGLVEGVIPPAIGVLISRWIPPSERGKLGSLIWAGGYLGYSVADLTGGLMIQRYHWSVFYYICGTLSIFWCLPYSLLCYRDPMTHPFIKQNERDYLIENIGIIDRTNSPAFPFKAIFSSVPFYALLVAQCGNDFALYILEKHLPQFFAEVLYIDIMNNFLYEFSPLLFMYIIAFAAGALSDYLINNGYATKTSARKTFTVIGAVLPAFFYITSTYIGCSFSAVITCYTIGVALTGSFCAGIELVPFELCPKYCGLLTALVNGSGAFMGFLAPHIITIITPDDSLIQWRLTFWMAVAILGAMAMGFCFWGTAEEQNFDGGHNSDNNSVYE